MFRKILHKLLTFSYKYGIIKLNKLNRIDPWLLTVFLEVNMMADPTNIFQRRIRQALAEKGMRAVDLSNATGISKARISQYTNGVYVPKSKAACLIAKAL